MDLLYPLLSSFPESSSKIPSVTVLVNREVPAADEKSFLATLKRLLEEFDRFPGTSGSAVFRREDGSAVEFSILKRFASEADHEAWLASPGFARWRTEVTLAGHANDQVIRYAGMESFFVSAKAPAAPPTWKMALLLLLAVYPTSLAVSHWLAPALANLPLFAGALVTSVLMVLSMTYVLVPVLTKLFDAWLHPAGSR